MTDPTAVTCKCGGNLVRVPGRWWVHQGYGPRCDNAEPAEPSPAPQTPAHDGSAHFYAENFGMSVGVALSQEQISIPEVAADENRKQIAFTLALALFFAGVIELDERDKAAQVLNAHLWGLVELSGVLFPSSANRAEGRPG